MITVASITEEMKEALKTYSRLGWRVIPLHAPLDGGCTCRKDECKSAGKHPRLNGWQHKATADPQRIDAWWKECPDANVGVVLGEASGIVDVEIDGENGEEKLRELFGGEPPRCPTFASARGRHHLFRWRAGLPNKATLPLAGIDLKIGNGGGSQSVFPPSRHHSGAIYRWIIPPGECTPPEIPDDVIERIRLAAEPRRGTSNGRAGHGAIPEGERNNRLFRLACRNASQPDLYELVRQENEDRCQPPLGEAEITAIVASARRYATDIPSILIPEGRTEAANARRLAARYGADILWCDAWGKWLVWDGRRWALDDICRIDALAKTVAEGVWQEVRRLLPTADKRTATAMLSYAKATASDTGIRHMIHLARSEPGVPIVPRELDEDSWALNCENGTLDLQTGKLRGHRRGDFFTKLAPVRYDPEARCPLWISFLKRILANDSRLGRYLQRLVGYCLTGSTQDHVLPFLYGSGANGKSTFVGTVLAMLGPDYAAKAAPELLLLKRNETHPTERADLFGKRFIAAIETEDGRRMAESLVKEITGGDLLRVRRMREDFWQFAPTHKIFFVANHKPIIKGTDYAIWRRVKLIPFSVTIADAEQNKELPERLKSELPGILAWAVRGCMSWQSDGLGEPEPVTEATGAYRADMDVLGQYLTDCCITGDGRRVGATDLYKSYKTWCEQAGERPVTQTAFGRLMTDRGYSRNRTGRLGTLYIGLSLQEY